MQVEIPEMWTPEALVQAVRDGHTFLVPFKLDKGLFEPNAYYIGRQQYSASGVTVGPQHTPDIHLTPEGNIGLTLYFQRGMVPDEDFYQPPVRRERITMGLPEVIWVGPVHAFIMPEDIDWDGLNRGQQIRVPRGTLRNPVHNQNKPSMKELFKQLYNFFLLLYTESNPEDNDENIRDSLSNAFNICLVAGEVRNGTAPDAVFGEKLPVFSTIIDQVPSLKMKVFRVEGEEEEDYSVLIYNHKSKNIPRSADFSQKAFGKFLGMQCPGQLRADVEIELSVMFKGRPSSYTSFYMERCKNLTSSLKLKFKKFLDSIQTFIKQHQLPVVVNINIGKSWHAEDVHLYLNDPSIPISRGVLTHIRNLCAHIGFQLTQQIIDEILQKHPLKENYRTIVEPYIPTWTVIMAFQAEDVFEGLFEEEYYDIIPNYLAWDEFEARLGAWEERIYQALDNKPPPSRRAKNPEDVELKLLTDQVKNILEEEFDKRNWPPLLREYNLFGVWWKIAPNVAATIMSGHGVQLEYRKGSKRAKHDRFYFFGYSENKRVSKYFFTLADAMDWYISRIQTDWDRAKDRISKDR